MKNAIVKIEGLSIENFKNVNKCDVSFVGNGEIINTIGIYGQNGSGKTAVIEAFNIFKYLLLDAPVQNDLYYFINADSDFFSIEYKLSAMIDNVKYKTVYSVRFSRDDANKKAFLTEEKIKITNLESKAVSKIEFKIDNGKLSNKISDSSLESNKDIISKDILLAAFKISEQLSKTIIFQDFLINEINKSQTLKMMLKVLSMYAKTNLFVVGMRETSLISAIDNITLNIRTDLGNNNLTAGTLLLNLFNPTDLPSDLLNRISPALTQINKVMTTIIPGFKLEYKQIKEELDRNGILFSTIQLVSIIGEKEIPLKFESEGIKKLISLCSALTAMYNNETVCLVVDELDSGIFEYLLGSLVKILHNGAKGQLIFTSHNLRPLETLPKQCIVFSTTNDQNRFIRMTNVKPNHNLRDFYLRTILLGGQKEELYDETDALEIERAFRKCKMDI